jgi:hypothetical protein
LVDLKISPQHSIREVEAPRLNSWQIKDESGTDLQLLEFVANAPRVSIGLQQVAKDVLDREKSMFKPRPLEEMLPTAEPPPEEPPAKVSQQYVYSSPGS